MILLDTDHLSVLQIPGSKRRQRLVARMALAIDEQFGPTIVSVEEQMRGWLASIAKERLVARQVGPYRELAGLFTFYAAFSIALFDDAAAAAFNGFRAGGIRIATMDLKIVSIAVSRNVLLLTANRQHFEKVPGLRFENWMDEPI